MLKIGNVTLKNKIIAAPLAGISNPVYRSLMMEHGVGLVVSEMISDKALHFQNAKTKEMCTTFEQEHPVSLQLFGADPETMAEASTYLTENTDCDMIDINMGCPMPKVVKSNGGSALLKEPKLAYDVMKAVVDHTNKPVTVKIRSGWDHDHINCVEIGRLAQKAGISAIAIHGRTRAQGYSGKCDLDQIKALKDAVDIPVIGNGDIQNVEDAKHMLEYTGVDGIMVGRGFLGKPYFAQELLAGLEGKPYVEPTYQERFALALEYTKRLCAYAGEKSGMAQMRGMATWFIAGIPFASSFKTRLTQMNTYQDMVTILDDFRTLLKKG